LIATLVKDIARSARNAVFSTRDPSALLVRARKARDDGNSQQAFKLVEPCLSSYVSDMDALLFLAELQLDLQNIVAAHFALTLALDLQPDDAAMYYRIGQNYEKMYCLEDAMRAYKLLLQREPDNKPARNALNRALRQIYDWSPV